MSHPAPAPHPHPHLLPPPLDILILGAGWLASQHLLPLLAAHGLSHAYTTRSGQKEGSIPFTFEPSSPSRSRSAGKDKDDDDDDEGQGGGEREKEDGEGEIEGEDGFKRLPRARTVLVCFPLKGTGQSRRLVRGYERAHLLCDDDGDKDGDVSKGEKKKGSSSSRVRWIQLGSTGIFTTLGWNDSSSPYDRSENGRAIAEDELLSLCGVNAVVLNLAGLYDADTRRPRDWVGRVIKGKEGLKGKGSLHLIHGRDVARGIIELVSLSSGQKGGGWENVGGRRWIVSDLRVYDWWELVMSWGGDDGEGKEYRRWVVELMREEGVRALPREKGDLGRALDGRAFWEAIGCWPGEGRLT